MIRRDNIVTRRFFTEAGVGKAGNCRVLELGCGLGEVTRLLADLVGESGYVVALDRSADVLEKARTASASQENIRFVQVSE